MGVLVGVVVTVRVTVIVGVCVGVGVIVGVCVGVIVGVCRGNGSGLSRLNVNVPSLSINPASLLSNLFVYSLK